VTIRTAASNLGNVLGLHSDGIEENQAVDTGREENPPTRVLWSSVQVYCGHENLLKHLDIKPGLFKHESTNDLENDSGWRVWCCSDILCQPLI